MLTFLRSFFFFSFLCLFILHIRLSLTFLYLFSSFFFIIFFSFRFHLLSFFLSFSCCRVSFHPVSIDLQAKPFQSFHYLQTPFSWLPVFFSIFILHPLQTWPLFWSPLISFPKRKNLPVDNSFYYSGEMFFSPFVYFLFLLVFFFVFFSFLFFLFWCFFFWMTCRQRQLLILLF